jgi:hypothetical protein
MNTQINIFPTIKILISKIFISWKISNVLIIVFWYASKKIFLQTIARVWKSILLGFAPYDPGTTLKSTGNNN